MPKQKKREISQDIPENLDEHFFYGFQLDDDQIYFRDCIWDETKRIVWVNAKAGSGKTLISFATANLLYKKGLYDGIIYIVSPYGEAKQGFLPGDITEKSEVYFEPLYQAIAKCNLFPDKVLYKEALMAQNKETGDTGYVKCLTHTYLRGTNFENKVVIVDEAQNVGFADLKKILTRVNDNCKVIVIGHNLQKDIDDPKDAFVQYMHFFESLDSEKVAICKLTKNYRGWISSMADSFEL